VSVSDFNPENPILDILMAPDTEPDWLIKDVVLQGTAVVLAGDAGAGKSYVTYTISLALAAGCEALSGIVPAGPPKRVVYFDEENSTGDRDKYLKRSYYGLYKDGKEPDLANLADNFWPVQYHLGDDDWMDRAAEWVEFVQPHLMVFDTATPAFNIQDENNNSEASQAMKHVRRLMAMTQRTSGFKASAIILKHAKVASGDKGSKGGPRMIRGAKNWKGAVDQQMFQVRAQGRPRKGGLQITRLMPDKHRAYGLSQTIFITPEWTDEDKTGLVLHGSYKPNKEHRQRLVEEEGEEDE
jgi:RecA-family ATPase